TAILVISALPLHDALPIFAIREVADLRVQRSRVQPGGYDVALTLRPSDRKAFAYLTRATVGRDLAFVVRNRIITLPRVDMAILRSEEHTSELQSREKLVCR